MTIHADLETLTETTGGTSEIEAGPVITNQTTQRLGCDCIMETAVYHHGRILGIGRRTRTIPMWLRRQLNHRDRGCSFPGCGNTRWVQAHHILYWSLGGPTDMNNLIPYADTATGSSTNTAGRSRGTPTARSVPPPRPDLDPRLKALVRTT